MDDRTRTALLGSIAKWRAIAFEGGEDRGGRNCLLCIAFVEEKDPNADEFDDDGYDIRDQAFCHGCPVKAKTGLSNCEGSPYHTHWLASFRALHKDDWPRKVIDKTTRAAAIAEYKFLVSLLPEGENENG